MFLLIAAVEKNGGIGFNNKIPWKLSLDMKFFKEKTINSMVIMGRKTWESLPIKPLQNRINVVISKTLKINELNINPEYIFTSIVDFIKWIYLLENLKKYSDVKKYVIGGATIYNQFLNMNLITQCFITHINKKYTCDKFLDINKIIYSNSFTLYEFVEDNIPVIIKRYTILNNEESEFLSVIKKIKNTDIPCMDRTKIGTKSIFGTELSFCLKNNKFPLMTSRRLPLRHIFEELMWILRGQTNNKILKDKNINIWTPNSTRDFLDKQGLTELEEDDIGSGYGFQLRHSGAVYKGCNKNYDNQGFD